MFGNQIFIDKLVTDALFDPLFCMAQFSTETHEYLSPVD